MIKANKRKKKQPNPQYFSLLAEIEITHLEEMLSSTDLYLEGVRDDIKTMIGKASTEQYDSEHEYLSHMESLNDDLVQVKEVEDISKKLSIVGLYMIVESFTNKIIKWVYNELDELTRENKLRSIHKWNNLKKELYNLCGFSLSEVSDYSIINELRCLNNVIKHSGYVDKHLAAFPSWRDKIDKEIDTNLIDFNKFSKSIPKYINNLVEKINDNQSIPS